MILRSIKTRLIQINKHGCQCWLIPCLILLLSLSLRFYRFNQRWTFHYDQSRDSLVAIQAIKLKKLPLNGPFTSAGPFVFGPTFYYLIIFSYLLLPHVITAPQILITVLNSLYPLIMYKAGEIAHSKKIGFVMGLFAALSPLHIERANNLTQHNLIAFFSALNLMFFILYLKKRKVRYLFFLGLVFGLALSLHYQSLNLIFYLPLTLVINNRPYRHYFKKILLIIMGVLLPNLPLLVWDYQLGWKNTNNILDYFLIGQYRLWVSNRWITYLGQFWPKYWSEIIGGRLIFGYGFIILSVFIIIYQLSKKSLKKTPFFLTLVFICQLIINRYYRGEKLTMYILYFQPLVIYFSSFTLVFLLEIKKIVGLLCLLIVLFSTTITDINLITSQTNLVSPINNLVEKLLLYKTNKKFNPYVYKNIEPAVGTMTSLILNFQGLCDDKNGEKIGFSTNRQSYPEIAQVSGTGPIVYVYYLSNLNLDDNDWFNVSASNMYNDILEWWRVKEFKSYFSLTKYFQAKLFGKTF